MLSANAIISIATYKFPNTFNVVVSSLSSSNPHRSANDTLMAFLTTVAPSRTVFLFILNESPELSIQKSKTRKIVYSSIFLFLPGFPALKAIIKIHSNNTILCIASITFVCNRYCTVSTTPLESSTLFQTTSLYPLHRSLFFSANKKILVGIATDIFDYIQTTNRFNLKMDCLTLVKTLSPMCRSDIMTLIY